MTLNRIAPFAACLALALAACQPQGESISSVATEFADSVVTPTPVATPTPDATATPAPTPFPMVTLTDASDDCVTAALLEIDCSTLQRDVREVELVSDGETLTVTVTIDGEPWEQFPDHFAVFQFDTDEDTATGSRLLGITHGMGTDANVFWGWTQSALTGGVEVYDEVGTLADIFGERDDLFTVVDDQTLRLEIPFDDIGSQEFNFIFSLQAPPAIGVFDHVPEAGGALAFPSGELTSDTQ